MAATYSSLVGVAVGGKYEIRRVLGAGGMGVVCEAIHLDLGKRVAIKLIDKSMKESELIVTRFRREARALGQINSEHIVDVFDVGADQRVGLYMVMEFLVGEDLQGRLEREKKIDVKTAVMVAHQIARGLAKAHEVGVIHRDLKPANVYLTQRDNGQLLVKLLDFGVSKLLGDDPGSARITGTGAPIGTPLYMSPEQAEGRDSVDGRADVWSLGAVLYEALAGAPPFADRGSYHGTIVGILTSRPKLLHDAAPWVPPAVAAVVDAMLVHDPLARLQNAGTVAQRLLDAFPTVLPDGTGHHTAVIVSQAAAAVDTTGDTEVFNSASMGALRTSNPVSYPVGPPSTRFVVRESGPPRSEQDSTRTIPDAGTGDALQTGSATPVGPHLRAHAEASFPSVSVSASASGPLDFDRTVKTSGTLRPPPSTDSAGAGPGSDHGPPSGVPRRRAKTAPLPPMGSPAGPAAVAVTPSAIDPLPSSMRDPTVLTRREAKSPERRSPLVTFLVVIVAIAVVAIAGFIAGRHVSPDSTGLGLFSKPAPPPTPTTPATPIPTTPAAPTAIPTTPSTATATAPPTASATETPTLPAPPPNASGAAPTIAIGASAPRPLRRLHPRPAPKPAENTDDVPSTTE